MFLPDCSRSKHLRIIGGEGEEREYEYNRNAKCGGRGKSREIKRVNQNRRVRPVYGDELVSVHRRSERVNSRCKKRCDA